MALVKSIEEKETHRRPSVHDEVEATFVVFGQEGATYLQIDTYGSPNRESERKVSQTMQFGPEGIAALRALLAGIK
ncbi:hypothetical protein [Celeribacter marinus]|uniref:hypothetical protein n=1 Tax=Celeribacter marinus TaxID=1397108 RepID=UPI003F6AB35A